MTTYKITRMYRDSDKRRTIATGLTLEAAQAHCSNPETSSSTCTEAAGKRRTARNGPWFDGYDEEKPRGKPRKLGRAMKHYLPGGLLAPKPITSQELIDEGKKHSKAVAPKSRWS